MILSILIPTYNRAEYLIKNIQMLENYIVKNNFQKDIEIIVSNNCSKDNTKEFLEAFRKKTFIDIKIYNQEQNLGLEKNALFVLDKANGENVMFLGDDDYIEELYLIAVVNIFKNNPKVRVIIPSFITINLEGIIENPDARDTRIKTKYFCKSFESCLENSWRGHQLSGVSFKKDDTLKTYLNNGGNNIYPFIFFVAYNSLRGDLIHLTKFPIKVTAAPQRHKDWNYGKDGLLTEIFQNYKILKNISAINAFQRYRLEMKILNVQSWRYRMLLKNGKFNFIKSIFFIIKSQNTSYITKFIFPFLLLKDLMKKMSKKMSMKKRKV